MNKNAPNPWPHPNMNQGHEGRQWPTMPTRPNAPTAQIAERRQTTQATPGATPTPALIQQNDPAQLNGRETGARQHAKSDDVIDITADVTDEHISRPNDINLNTRPAGSQSRERTRTPHEPETQQGRPQGSANGVQQDASSDTDSLEGFQMVERRPRAVSFFVCGIKIKGSPESTRSAIQNYLQKRNVRVTHIRILKKGRMYMSVKINVDQIHKETVSSQCFWPDGVQCRQWIYDNGDNGDS